ncbi:response regulator [Dyella sp.]|uniref:response regulator n=1 Tax=Dyella sp. TaxID=1869338 RepID=UPI002ED3AAFD
MDTVLLVEDDPAVADITSMVLEDAGYEVLCASDAKDAQALASSRQDIDVVLTDVNLRAGADGLALVQGLRDGGLEAAVVVMSGDLSWASKVDRSIRFLAKPYGTHELLTLIAQACEKKH